MPSNSSKEYRDAWRARNKERCRAWRKKYDDSHRPQIKERGRAYRLRRHYGLSREDFNALMKNQGGKCEICKSSEWIGSPGRSPTVDHDHKTGEVRALLCGRCNACL